LDGPGYKQPLGANGEKQTQRDGGMLQSTASAAARRHPWAQPMTIMREAERSDKP